MKKHIFQFVAAAAIALVGWSCEADYFNEHELDGYVPGGITDVQKLEYTLTEGNYTSIAKNETNVALAEELGETDLLKAIGDNKYFQNEDDAIRYIPAFLTASTNYLHLDTKSVIKVSYTSVYEMPEEMQAMNAAVPYEVSAAEYTAAWKNQEESFPYLTPKTVVNLPNVMSGKDLEEGQYVAVSYQFVDDGSEPDLEEEAFAYSSVIGTIKEIGSAITIKGTVTGIYARGYILSDKSGSILVYQPAETPELGANVTVSGTVSSYNNGYQLANATFVSEKSALYMYNDVPVAIDDTNIDEVYAELSTGTHLAYYGSITGKLSISGSYYNITCGGSSKQGSISYPTKEITDQLKDGENITVNGYIFAVSGGKYVNILATSIGETEVAYMPVPAPYGDGSERYLLVSNKNGTDYAFTALDAGKTYGYPAGTAITISDNKIAADDADDSIVLTLKPSSNGSYTISDSSERYYYQSGTFKSFNVDTTLGDGFNWTFSLNDDGTVAITNDNGYWIQFGDGTYTTWGAYSTQSGSNPVLYRLVTVPAVNPTKAVSYAVRATAAAADDVKSKLHYAFYQWDGEAFVDPGIVAVQPTDYTEMGFSGFFTDGAQVDYLPKFLAKNFPYAFAGDVKYVAYLTSSTNWLVDEFTFDGSVWTRSDRGLTTKTSQFRKFGKDDWRYYPTYEIYYTTVGDQEFKNFCQYCANWVYDNIDVKLGAPARDNEGEILSNASIKVNGATPAGTYFVSSYGNNEWFAGSYAFYGEMNWRDDQAKTPYKNVVKVINQSGMDLDIGIDDLGAELDAEVLVKAMQRNAATVFANVLHYMYPDMSPTEYTTVIIYVYNYASNTATQKGIYAYSFDVIATGEFEYVEDSFEYLGETM